MNSTPARAVAGESREGSDVEEGILQAALAEFETFGMRKANIDDVAQVAGVSRSTLYRYFPNKKMLLAAVLARVTEDVRRQVVDAARGQDAKGTVVEAFCTLMRVANTNMLARKLVADSANNLYGISPPVRVWAFSDGAQLAADTLRRAGATMPDNALLATSELLMRIAVSYVETAPAAVPFASAKEVRSFAQKNLAVLVY